MQVAFLKASPEAKYIFWIKSRTVENTGKIFAEQSYPEFQKEAERVREG